MRPPPEMGVRWPKQARHTSQMVWLRMREVSEELIVAAPARPPGRDGVMTSPPPPRRRTRVTFRLESSARHLGKMRLAKVLRLDNDVMTKVEISGAGKGKICTQVLRKSGSAQVPEAEET